MVGLFINVLPLRVRMSSQEAILPWLKKLQERQVEIRQYEYCSLVQVQGWSEVPRGLPLFESVLAFDNYPSHTGTGKQISGLEIRPGGTLERSNCPLQLNAVPGSELMFQLTYDQPRFDAHTILRMLEHLKMVLENIGSGRRDRISALSCVTQQERELWSAFCQAFFASAEFQYRK
jgi:non-ribosomal peptide synthetase component F